MYDNFTKGKLQRIPYAFLPTGSVRASGWLLDQLKLQAGGFLRDMENYPDYGPKSGWKGGNGENWEDGPYYLRGLVITAYTLDDAELIARAKVWIESILTSQREDGMFGPRSNEDWWSRMPVLMALRDYYEATVTAGEPDERILPFMERYFRGQLKNLPANPLVSWAKARGGDNVDSILWLYNHLYREDDPTATDWLLELSNILRAQTTDWVRLMHETTVRTHVVNTSQAMKTPPLWYLLSGDPIDRSALESGLRHIAIDHGRIDGLPNSDEAARDNQSTRGSELCGIVEGMLSAEIAFSILGDPLYCDRLEKLAYNALPAAYAPDYSGHVYFILQNQVLATTGYHEFDCDHGDSSAFSAPSGFDCCFANNHMGWGKFVKSLWMASSDGGLAIVAYGPSTVDTVLPCGRRAAFSEDTEYPFREKTILTYHGEDAEFALHLPIPAWCKSSSLSVCGEPLTVPAAGTICRIRRAWSEGDTVEINFPMEITLSEWYNRSVAVNRGPLIYSLKIDEEWSSYTDNGTRELKGPIFGCVKSQEVRPKSRWNYALLPNVSTMSVEYAPLGAQPYRADSAPIRIRARGQVVPEWKLDGNRAAAQPFGGVIADETAQNEIELIPYGSARLKITHFPRAVESTDRIYRQDPIVSERQEKLVCEFANVTLPIAKDYDLIISPEKGSNYQLFLNGNLVDVIDNQVKNLSRFSEHLKFGSYNSFVFRGDPVNAIEIIPVEPILHPEILKVETSAHSLSITVNVSRENYGYEIDFGCESKVLDRHLRGFKGSTAEIVGLDPDTDYYFRLTGMIGGKRYRSEVSHAKTASETLSDPTPPVFSESISPETVEIVSEENRYTLDEGLIRVEATDDFKLLLKQGTRWKDYEASVDLTLLGGHGNAGLIFSATAPTHGPNAYRGYYFGISTGGAVIGVCNRSWNELATASLRLSEGIPYRLTVRTSDGRILCLLNGQEIFALANSEHAEGSVGLRTYQETFSAEALSVAPLTQEASDRLLAIEKPIIGDFCPTVTTAFELVQVTYPKVPGADHYQIDYGSSSGFYRNSIMDIRFNPYKGSSPFTADKTAFTFTGTTCYLKMSAWCGDRMLAISNEISAKIDASADEN